MTDLQKEPEKYLGIYEMGILIRSEVNPAWADWATERIKEVEKKLEDLASTALGYLDCPRETNEDIQDEAELYYSLREKVYNLAMSAEKEKP